MGKQNPGGEAVLFQFDDFVEYIENIKKKQTKDSNVQFGIYHMIIYI